MSAFYDDSRTSVAKILRAFDAKEVSALEHLLVELDQADDAETWVKATTIEMNLVSEFFARKRPVLDAIFSRTLLCEALLQELRTSAGSDHGIR